jgi:protein-S-isoprenylcysteine O-methyltransferase Ste14
LSPPTRMPSHDGLRALKRLVAKTFGSLVGLLLVMAALLWRILDEERFLARHLPGYVEYQHKVRYRLLPYIW